MPPPLPVFGSAADRGACPAVRASSHRGQFSRRLHCGARPSSGTAAGAGLEWLLFVGSVWVVQQTQAHRKCVSSPEWD